MDGPQIQYNNSVCVLAHSMTPGCPPGTFLGSGLGGDPLRTHEAVCYETKWANEVNNFFNSSGFIFRSPQISTVGDSDKTGSCLSLAPGELVAESLALCRPLRVFGVQRELLKPFYDSMVASAFFYGVVCWSSSFSSGHRKKLNRLYFGVASRPAERRNSLNQFATA